MSNANATEQPGTVIPALLLIEDDPAVAAFIQEALEMFFSVDVLVARTADQARNLWRQQRESLIVAILSDLNLPGESGLSVVYELSRERANVLVVFATGDSHREPEIIARIGAPVRVLPKPFRPSELRGVFEAILPAKQKV